MLTKGNHFILLPVINSDAHHELSIPTSTGGKSDAYKWQSIPTSTGGKLRCSRRVISSYLYRW